MNPPSAEISRAMFQSTMFHRNFARFLSEPEHKQSECNQQPNNNAEPVIARLKPDKFCSTSSASSSSTPHSSSVSPAADATPTPRDSYEHNRYSLPIVSTRFAPVEADKFCESIIERSPGPPEPQQFDNGLQRVLPYGQWANAEQLVRGIDVRAVGIEGGQPAMSEGGGQPAVPQGGGQPAVPGGGGQPAVPEGDGQPAVPQGGGQPAVPGGGGQPAVPQGDGQPAVPWIVRESSNAQWAAIPSSTTAP